MTYREQAPVPTEPTKPPLVYPYGYGRWRCPACGAFMPYVSTTAIEHNVKQPDERVVLMHQHYGGCSAAWLTEPRVPLRVPSSWMVKKQ